MIDSVSGGQGAKCVGHMTVVLSLGNLGEEDSELEASLDLNVHVEF